jgi:CubicO group peptidase (beta-lactamase class C family)
MRSTGTRIGVGAALAVLLAIALAPPAAAQRRSREAKEVIRITRQVMRENHLMAAIVRVQRGRRPVATAALGNTMTNVPATPDMRWRIGSIAIPYMTTVMLQLRDKGKLSLNDTVSKWYPRYPNADKVTLKMLAHVTSGYPDFIQENPTFEAVLLANPFRQFDQQELLRFAFAQPLICAPGQCFHYAHTNFIILGQILAKVTRQPVATFIRRRILRPLKLDRTASSQTAEMPPPVLHAFGFDRGPYEDTTSWTPSWGLGRGMLLYSDIKDVATSAEPILGGRLLSRSSRRQLVAPFPTPGQPQQPFYYASGLAVIGKWRVQNPYINNYGGVQAYLPSKRLTIAVVSTVGIDGNQTGENVSQVIFQRIANRLAPSDPVELPG